MPSTVVSDVSTPPPKLKENGNNFWKPFVPPPPSSSFSFFLSPPHFVFETLSASPGKREGEGVETSTCIFEKVGLGAMANASESGVLFGGGGGREEGRGEDERGGGVCLDFDAMRARERERRPSEVARLWGIHGTG